MSNWVKIGEAPVRSPLKVDGTYEFDFLRKDAWKELKVERFDLVQVTGKGRTKQEVVKYALPVMQMPNILLAGEPLANHEIDLDAFSGTLVVKDGVGEFQGIEAKDVIR